MKHFSGCVVFGLMVLLFNSFPAIKLGSIPVYYKEQYAHEALLSLEDVKSSLLSWG